MNLIFFKHSLLVLLQSLSMSLVDASLSVQCVGRSTFFWLPRYGGCNFLSYDVNGEWLSPNDDLFSDSLLVCMECRSFLKTNK